MILRWVEMTKTAGMAEVLDNDVDIKVPVISLLLWTLDVTGEENIDEIMHTDLDIVIRVDDTYMSPKGNYT